MLVRRRWCRFRVAQMMRATDFEYRRQALVHLLIVATSFLTYFLDRNDIVWALVRGQSHPQLLERLLFSIATILIGLSTAIRTWARAYQVFSVSSYASPGRRDGPYRYVLYPRGLS